MQLHSSIVSALSHPTTWAGFAGVMSTMGTQLDKPFAIICYGFSALFSMVAILIKTPDAAADKPKG